MRVASRPLGGPVAASAPDSPGGTWEIGVIVGVVWVGVGVGVGVGVWQSGAIVMDCAWVAVSSVASDTLRVKSNVAAVVGVPVMAPSGPRVRPGGRLPDSKDQLNGGAPPSTVGVWAE